VETHQREFQVSSIQVLTLSQNVIVLKRHIYFIVTPCICVHSKWAQQK